MAAVVAAASQTERVAAAGGPWTAAQFALLPLLGQRPGFYTWQLQGTGSTGTGRYLALVLVLVPLSPAYQRSHTYRTCKLVLRR